MLLTWLDVRWARAAFWLMVSTITVLALIPAPEVPASSGWDKLDHWLAFFTLSALADRAFPARVFWSRIALVLVAYGIAIEVAQYFTPDRQADVMDVVADSVGIVIYGLLRQLTILLSRPLRAE
jgi:VanZ family protein